MLYKVGLIDIRNNPLQYISIRSFRPFEGSTILVDRYSSCCFVNSKEKCICTHSKSTYLTCQRMFPSIFLRISLILLGIVAISTNLISCFVHSSKRNKTSQSKFLMHLSLADLIMGVDMLLLACVDIYYSDYFPSFSEKWRNGITCKIASFLSIISSEASVFLLSLISFDRCMNVKYPLGALKMGTKTLFVIWLISAGLGVISVSLSYFDTNMFDVSEVCVGLPMVTRTKLSSTSETLVVPTLTFYARYYTFSVPEVGSWFWRRTRLIHENQISNVTTTDNVPYISSEVSGHQLASYFSIIVFIGINIICFLFILVCYINILHDARKSSKNMNRQQESTKLAFKVSLVILTDFLCWIPLCVICLFVQLGIFSVSPQVYAWTVAFILPINSSINPFLYTLSSEISKYFSKRSRSMSNI